MDQINKKSLHRLRQKTGAILGGRFKKCGCVTCSNNSQVQVIKYEGANSNNAFFAGVVTCGSLWGCPVCAAKKSIEKGSELADVIKYSAELDKKIGFVTLTIPHGYGENIEDLSRFIRESWRLLTSYSAFKNAKKRGVFDGYVKSIETTYGKNGWHVHIHLLFIGDSELMMDGFLKDDFFKLWARVVEKVTTEYKTKKVKQIVIGDGKEVEIERVVRVKDKEGNDIISKPGKICKKRGYKYVKAYDASITEYLTKWDLSKEMTSTMKSGAGLTPMQLAIRGTKQDILLFRRFVKAFKGVSKVRYSIGFKSIREDIQRIKKEVAESIKKDLQEVGELSRFIFEKKHVLSVDLGIFKLLAKHGLQTTLLEKIEEMKTQHVVLWLRSLFDFELKETNKGGVTFLSIKSE